MCFWLLLRQIYNLKIWHGALQDLWSAFFPDIVFTKFNTDWKNYEKNHWQIINNKNNLVSVFSSTLPGSKCVLAEGSTHLETDGKMEKEKNPPIYSFTMFTLHYHINFLLSVALSGGCRCCKAIQQKHIHREPRRPSLLSWPHVQPCRLAAAIQTHVKSGA